MKKTGYDKRSFIRNSPISKINKTKYFVKVRPTKSESILWDSLKESGLGNIFYFQYKISRGYKDKRRYYYIDFYCPVKKLAIEIDGGYHSNWKQQNEDAFREADIKYLSVGRSRMETGIKFLRFTNDEVNQNPAFVMSKIVEAMKDIPDAYEIKKKSSATKKLEPERKLTDKQIEKLKTSDIIKKSLNKKKLPADADLDKVREALNKRYASLGLKL